MFINRLAVAAYGCNDNVNVDDDLQLVKATDGCGESCFASVKGHASVYDDENEDWPHPNPLQRERGLRHHRKPAAQR